MVSVDNKPRNFLVSSEIDQLLKAARKGRHGARDHAMLLLGFRHGFRVSELIDVRISDLDLERGTIFVRRIKGSLSTSQPIQGDEIRALRKYLRESGKDSIFLFTSERGGPMTRQAVNYLIKQAARRAGISINVHPHVLRHSCGHQLADKGLDTRLIQDWLGHANIGNTTIYTRTSAARFATVWA